jgi:hypothetical protein
MASGERQVDDGSALPKHTTPTWEVELLISGVAVFAMLQLPGLLDDALFALQPRFDPAWVQPAKILYIYLKSVAVILAATFSIHLLLRARWIALVGMHSVYPDGVRWERMRMGPVQREVAEVQHPAAAVTIDRADNRATVVFSVGVMMATVLLTVSLAVALLFAAAIGAFAMFAVQVPLGAAFSVCAILLVLPLGLSILLDRRAGARLPSRGRARRALAALFRGYGRIGFAHGNPILNLLASHGGERRSTLLMFAIFVPVMLGITFALKVAGHPERFGGYAGFPQPSPSTGRVLDAAHYDRLRDTGRDPAVPYVQDAVVIGPYLQLHVPYRPGDDDAAIARDCPAVAGAADAARDGAVLDCLQRLHAVAMDGKPVRDLRYDAGSDPRTDRPALVAMIDVRALARGRHELRVARTDAGAADRAAGAAEYVIPFWR